MTEETGMVVREINSQVVHADILSPFGSHHGFDAAQKDGEDALHVFSRS